MPFQPMPPSNQPTQQVTQQMQRVHPSAGYQRAPKRSKAGGSRPWLGLVLLVVIVGALAAWWLCATRPKAAGSGQTGVVAAQQVNSDPNNDPLSDWTIEASIERWWNTSTADAQASMCWNVAHDWLEAWATVRQIDPVEGAKADSEERSMAALGDLCGVRPEPYDEEECGC